MQEEEVSHRVVSPHLDQEFFLSQVCRGLEGTLDVLLKIKFQKLVICLNYSANPDLMMMMREPLSGPLVFSVFVHFITVV